MELTEKSPELYLQTGYPLVDFTHDGWIQRSHITQDFSTPSYPNRGKPLTIDKSLSKVIWRRDALGISYTADPMHRIEKTCQV